MTGRSPQGGEELRQRYDMEGALVERCERQSAELCQDEGQTDGATSMMLPASTQLVQRAQANGVLQYDTPDTPFRTPAAAAPGEARSRYPLEHERPGAGAQLPSAAASGAPTRQATAAPNPLDVSDASGVAEGQEAQPPPTPWLGASGGGEVACGGTGSGTGQISSSGAGTEAATMVFKSGLTRRSGSKQRSAATTGEDELGPLPFDAPDLHSSPNGSGSNWVDTVTLWSAVQRTGEEIQRKRRMEESVPGSKVVGAACSLGQWRHQAWRRLKTTMIVTSRVAYKDPWTVAIPLLLLVLLLAFGLWGVFSVAYAIRDSRILYARNAAVDYGKKLASHITATVAPASTVKTLIQLDPEWPDINETFYKVAPGLIEDGLQKSAIITIVLAPQGVVSSIIPDDLPAWKPVYGLNLLRNESWRGDALKTVSLQGEGGQRDMVMTGPSRLRAGMMGLVTRHAVFVDGGGPAETWGYNMSAYNCTPCWLPGDQTTPSRRFWGFAQLNVDWEILVRNITRLYDLCERDSLHFNMTYIDPVTFVNRSIAACGDPRDHPISIDVDVMHNHWSLAVYDSRGWTPEWLPLVVAVVVFACLWISATLAIILINRREHMWLLQAMLPKKVIAALRRGEDYAEAFESVTVLFSDIVSYTTLASQLEPIKVVRLLNEMYSAFDVLVDEFDCYKVETIGDAFMAVCGTQGEDPVTAAVRVARLAQAMVERTKVLVSQDGQRVQIRIGLHSGPVVGAVVGFKMPHFCLCGDTVNTASRMESNSKPMHIHVSGTTAKLLQESCEGFALEPRGPVTIKGKGTMWTYWLAPAVAAADFRTTEMGAAVAGPAVADGSSSHGRQQLQEAEGGAGGHGGAAGVYGSGEGDRLTFGEVSLPPSLMVAGGAGGAGMRPGMGAAVAAPVYAMPSIPMEQVSATNGGVPHQAAASLDGGGGASDATPMTAGGGGSGGGRGLGHGMAFNTAGGAGPVVSGGAAGGMVAVGSGVMMPLAFSNNTTESHGLASGGGGRSEGPASVDAAVNSRCGVGYSSSTKSGRVLMSLAVAAGSNGSGVDASVAAAGGMGAGPMATLSRNGGGGSGRVSDRFTPVGAGAAGSGSGIVVSGCGAGANGGVFYMPSHAAAFRVDGDDPPIGTESAAAAAAASATGAAAAAAFGGSTADGIGAVGAVASPPTGVTGVMLRLSMPSPAGSSPLVGSHAAPPSTGLPSGGRPSYSSRPHSRLVITETSQVYGAPSGAYSSAGTIGHGLHIPAAALEGAAATAAGAAAAGVLPVGSPQVFQSGMAFAGAAAAGHGYGYGYGGGYGGTGAVSAGQHGLVSMGSLDVAASNHMVGSPMLGSTMTGASGGAVSGSGLITSGRRAQRTMSHMVSSDVVNSMLAAAPSEREREREKPIGSNLIAAMLGSGIGDRKAKRGSVDLRLFQQSPRNRDRGT